MARTPIAVEPEHVVSFSELDTIRQCLFKHRLAYRERWQEPTMGEALAKGILWHNVMESHYKALKQIQDDAKDGVAYTDKAKVQKVHDAIIGWLRHPQSGKQSEHQELIEWMYSQYIQHWGLDDDWEIMAVEHSPVVNLPGGQFALKLKIDLVVTVRSTQQLWIVDHKSGKDLPNDKMLEIADQFGLYAWALRQLGRPVFGAIHNATRTQRNKDPKTQPPHKCNRRTMMYRTDRELDTLAQEAAEAFRQAYRLETSQLIRSPNEDTCRWRCSFTEPCLMARKGLDIETLLPDFGFIQDFTRH